MTASTIAQAAALIAAAQHHLSPNLYTAFLRWGETASRTMVNCQTDEEQNERCFANGDAISILSETASVNVHDLMLKSYLLALEASDSPVMGPLDPEKAERSGDALRHLATGIGADMFSVSPLPGMIDELSRTAFHLSGSTLAWSTTVGATITDAFTAARRNVPDGALMEAFAARRREFEASEGVDMTKAEDNAYFTRIDAQEAVLRETPATTIGGVLTKLRVAFLHQTGQDWSDLAITDPTQSTFVNGLASSDIFTRLARSGIEDLARIGKIDLAEQGR